MRLLAPLLMVASALGSLEAIHVPHPEKTAPQHFVTSARTAGLNSDKVHADVAQVHGHSVQHGAVEVEKHSKPTQAHRRPLTMLRTSHASTAAVLERSKQAPSTQTTPVLDVLVNSTAAAAAAAAAAADHWRLIAAGRMPAELPKKDTALAASTTRPPPAVSGGGERINRSEPMAAHHRMQELAGGHHQQTQKSLWSYHTDAHDHRDEPKKEEKNGTLGEYSSGGHDKYHEPREIFGLPKIFWALVANVIAMACFIACIPFILSVAKRRRPISSS